MIKDKMYDVAIAGGGPAGSRTAYRLAEMGWSVIVLEKKADPGEPVCCTGIISRECVDEFAIDRKVIYREASSASVFSPSGKLLRVERHEPQAYTVDRAAFNAYLAGLATDKGAEYITGSRVTGIRNGPDRVEIEVTNARAEIKRITARAAVIADGFGSKLVRQSGLPEPGDFAMGAQAEVETNGIEEVEVYTGGETAPGFFAWLVPIKPGRALAGLITRQRTTHYMKKLLSSLERQGKILPGEPEINYAGVVLQSSSRTSSERILAVGSAAGQVKPVTGGGVYYGMVCADIAAENLHRALENDNLTTEGLSSYDRQWKKSLGREMRTGYRARKFYERLSDDRIDKIFDIIKASGIDETLLNADDIRFDSHAAVILKLVGHRALPGILGNIRIPFLQRKDR